jgi:hypothetical protein
VTEILRNSGRKSEIRSSPLFKLNSREGSGEKIQIQNPKEIRSMKLESQNHADDDGLVRYSMIPPLP